MKIGKEQQPHNLRNQVLPESHQQVVYNGQVKILMLNCCQIKKLYISHYQDQIYLISRNKTHTL